MQAVEASEAAEIRNPYRPSRMRIASWCDETPDVRTLQLQFVDPREASAFAGWDPGQFGEFTVFGEGECVFALASTWHRAEPGQEQEPIECTFRAIGKVTHALRRRSLGQVIGFRGPYGNAFPVHDWEGRDLVFLGGGIGMAALRSPLHHVLEHRDRYGEIVVLNGARSVADMVYREEMGEWMAQGGVRVVRTVDPGGENAEWDGQVGLIPKVFEGLGLEPEGRVVVACGPPIMLHFLFLSLGELGYCPDQVITTLENKMKCGIGHCGRCNIGPFYVCRDGPVVSWRQMQELPRDF